MNLQEWWTAITGSIKGLSALFWQKISLAVITAMASEAVGMHATLLGCFVTLVIIDLLTKWVGLAKKYLVEQGVENVSLIKSIIAIPKARAAGVINSEVMKHRFLGKIIIYIFVMIIAGIADNIFITIKSPALIVNLAVCYLAVTEVISILENMQEAGAESCSALINLIKNKTGMGR